jgi:ferredoxin-type protein NapH
MGIPKSSCAIVATVLALLLISSSFMVSSNSASRTVAHAQAFDPSPSEQTHSLTFTESGFPSGSSWTVILNSVYQSSYSNSITFSVTDGSYSFNIPKMGGWPTVYEPSPSSGTITVKGENVNVHVTFTLPPPKLPLSLLLLLLIITTLLAAVILAAVLYRRRKATIIHRRRKNIRYLRWASKAAFLLFFTVPVVYLIGAPLRPVYSLLFDVWVGKPWLKVPITQSVCIIWTTMDITVIDPGTWIMCPIGACSTILTGMVDAFRVIPTIIAMLIFIIPIVLLGNVFCSWVCPIGTIIDSFDKAIEKKFPKFEDKRSKRSIQSRQSKNNGVRSHLFCSVCPAIKLISVSKVISNRIGVLAYGILGSAVVGSFVFHFPVFCCVCPMGIISRGMTHLKALSMRLPTARVTGQYMAIVPELLVIPIAAVLVSLREKRFWCRYLCPLGALLNALGTLNPFIKPRVKGDSCVMKCCPEDCEEYHIDYCGWCRYFDDRKCEKVCPVGINLVDLGSLHKCTKCMECYIVCDWNAITIDLVGKPDVSRIGGFFKRLKTRRQKAQTTSIKNPRNATGQQRGFASNRSQ